jgi:hypothetical protein
MNLADSLLVSLGGSSARRKTSTYTTTQITESTQTFVHPCHHLNVQRAKTLRALYSTSTTIGAAVTKIAHCYIFANITAPYAFVYVNGAVNNDDRDM